MLMIVAPNLSVPGIECLGCGYLGCEMFGIWEVQDAGCLGYEMFGIRDVWYVGCLGYEVFRMCDIWCVDARGAACGIWDVCWDLECWFAKYRYDWGLLECSLNQVSYLWKYESFY